MKSEMCHTNRLLGARVFLDNSPWPHFVLPGESDIHSICLHLSLSCLHDWLGKTAAWEAGCEGMGGGKVSWLAGRLRRQPFDSRNCWKGGSGDAAKHILNAKHKEANGDAGTQCSGGRDGNVTTSVQHLDK